MLFFCEATGISVDFPDITQTSVARIDPSVRVFSSDIVGVQHVDKEVAEHCLLAHEKCFDLSEHSTVGFEVTHTGNSVWCKNDFLRSPKRYVVIVGAKIVKQAIVSESSLVPFILVDSCVDNEAVRLAAEFLTVAVKARDPFDAARLVKAMRDAGKSVGGVYKCLSEPDLADLLGMSQGWIHLILQLNYASPKVRKAYYDGSLKFSRVARICRLSEKQQDDFLDEAKRTTIHDLNRKVSEILRDTGNLTGRSGYARNYGNRWEGKVRSLENLTKVERKLRYACNNGRDTSENLARLAGIQYALSILKSVDDEPKLDG